MLEEETLGEPFLFFSSPFLIKEGSEAFLIFLFFCLRIISSFLMFSSCSSHSYLIPFLNSCKTKK